MKRSEVTGCLRLYRKGIDAHAKLREKLKAACVAAEGVPLLRQAKKDLEEAEGELARIGDGLSVLPELADEVLLLRQRYALLKDQAAQEGIVCRRGDDELSAADRKRRDDDAD